MQNKGCHPPSRSFRCSFIGKTGGCGSLDTVRILEAFQICKNQGGEKTEVTKVSNIYTPSYWQKNKQENNIKLKRKKGRAENLKA